ncbi:putative C6 and C2H2 transcription factor [Stemphylium lycopersici]|nr:putative C6 and C2H2 transcription factor [Stemphylium lycopersici]
MVVSSQGVVSGWKRVAHLGPDKWDTSALDANKDAAPLWPMATYQAILLNMILLLTATPTSSSTVEVQSLESNSPKEPSFPPVDTTILLALVKTCRKRNMFSYPAMLAQYQQTELTPHTALPIWIGIEEAKRFALTLWHVWQIYCASRDSDSQDGGDADGGEAMDAELDGDGGVEIACRDLQFSVPVSDDIWNAESLLGFVKMVEGEKERGNQICDNEMNWICNWEGVV